MNAWVCSRWKGSQPSMAEEFAQLGRKCPWVELNVEQAGDILQDFKPGANVTRCEGMLNGLCNTNYKVFTDAFPDPLVLRIFTHQPEKRQRELSLMRAVQPHVPVPSVLFCGDAHAHLPAPYAWLTWAEGTHLEDLLASETAGSMENIGVAVGKALAGIGRVQFSAAGEVDEQLHVNEPFDSLGKLLTKYVGDFLFAGNVGARLGPDTTQQLWKTLVRNAHCVDALPETRSLVHGDFIGKNILLRKIDAEWQVSAVLDWEFAYAGSPLGDLATMIGFHGVLSKPFYDGLLSGFKAGGGLLPPGWIRAARLIDLLALCTSMNMDPDGRVNWDGTIQEIRFTAYHLDSIPD